MINDVLIPAGLLWANLPAPDADALAATAVAFANTDGGVIVIGVDSSGTYTGPLDGRALGQALREAGERCTPPIVLDGYEVLPTPGGPAIMVHVPRSPRVHALPDGRVLVQSVAGLRALSGAEIRQLLSARAGGEFEAEVVPGARISDLDPDLFAEYAVRRARRLRRPWQRDLDLLMAESGAITPDYRVTVAGVLLFGRDPQRWLPNSGAQFVRTLGTPENGAYAAIERTFNGPLVRLVDTLWSAIRAQMRSDVPGSAPRPPEYTAGIVRELLVNAIGHRDYRLRGERIAVRLYDDRLEIASPGGLPGFMTEAGHMITHRYRRNPRVCAVLGQWGYGAGQGLLSIFEQVSEAALHPPEVAASSYRVTVTLYAARDTTESGASAPLNARQQAALDYVRAHGSITVREFRARWVSAAPTELQRDLTGLVAAGYLRKIGTNGGYYILA